MSGREELQPQPSTDKRREEIADLVAAHVRKINRVIAAGMHERDAIYEAADAIMALFANPEQGPEPVQNLHEFDGEWRDIASAPKDGTRVLMWGPDWDSPMTHEWLNAEIAAAELRNWIDPPTHWRRLPAPPSNPETKGEA